MTLPPVCTPARKLLRDATHVEHVRLNQHPLLIGIARPGYALSTYRLVLAAYYHFYRELELAIDQALGAGVSSFVYGSRRKLSWLVSDLKFLGIDPDLPAHRPRTPLASMVLADEGQLLGALYTIEGSSLGGQVISRHLATHLGLSAPAGARFFHGYGDATTLLWAQFESFMNAALIDEAKLSRARHTAKSTFATMEAVLDDYVARSQSANRP